MENTTLTRALSMPVLTNREHSLARLSVSDLHSSFDRVSSQLLDDKIPWTMKVHLDLRNTASVRKTCFELFEALPVVSEGASPEHSQERQRPQRQRKCVPWILMSKFLQFSTLLRVVGL